MPTSKSATKKLRPMPSLPPEAASWSKDELGSRLLDYLDYDLSPAVASDLLPRQLEACCGGVRAAEGVLDRARNDETAQRYEQIMQQEIDEALELLDDHFLIFFMACQLYVTRVVETVRSFKQIEGGRCGLAATYEDDTAIRALGRKLPMGLTAAECLWHLGNYAKHCNEIEDFSAQTKEGLTKLTVIGISGERESGAEASLRGIAVVSGRNVGSLNDAVEALREVERLLRAWADQLNDEVVADLDQWRYEERGRTKREREALRLAFSSVFQEIRASPRRDPKP